VVDDGSPPPAAAGIAATCAEWGSLLLVQPQAGPGRARNLGAAHARGQYLAFTDDDCLARPDWLAVLAASLAAHPGAAVGGQTLNRLSRNPYAAASQALVGFLYRYYNHDPQRAVVLTSNNLAVPADGFRALGGFEEAVRFAAAEDREWTERWRFYGRPLIYTPAAVVDHAHNLSLSAFVHQHFRYGRGAYYCRLARQRRGQPPPPVEPLAFYFHLARAMADAMPRGLGWYGRALAFVSQAAHTLGFFWQQRLSHADPVRSLSAVPVSNENTLG
jgi:GT2 family glycosyltransferase